LTWDVIVVSTLVSSYLSSSARSAGAAADLAASRKEAKYTSLTNSYYIFQPIAMTYIVSSGALNSTHSLTQPIAVEFHGAFSASARSFLATLGERLTGTSGDSREMSYLFQRLGQCTAFQFGLIHDRFVSADEEPDV